MISLKTPTKSLTSQPLTDEQRERLIEFIAERYLDGMSGRDLERFFYDIQRDYMQDYTDDELIGALEDVTAEDELEEMIGGLNEA